MASAQAQVLAEAEVVTKIALAKKPTSKPMSIAYMPLYDRYYVADGGLAPMGSETEAPISKSEIHVYSADGKYVQSAKPGFDNRSIYFNTDTQQLETVTYNISSNAGFSPNTGVFALDLDGKGNLKETSRDISGFNAAFGDASTIPTYDPKTKHYFAKQGRSNAIFVVDLNNTEKLEEIKLDLKSANVQFDDITDYYAAFTGIKGEELAVLDVDHKAVLIFDIKGKFVAKSELPKTLKLRSQNHIAGLGYANDLFFVYHEPEGEFGTFYGFKVFSAAK
ncbi:MAG: hypothetical protein EBV25_05690 [Methylophilaceae bacterium]|nr:hypothetical protein [Methylophilaceae bacterium]